MTIYVDVLIVLNIYVNYFLLLGTSKLTHTNLKVFRNVVASLIGSFFSLTILLPSMPYIFSLILKLIASAIIVVIAFGAKDIKRYFKMLFYFYGVNFIFAGVIMAIYLSFKPTFLHFNNSYFYMDFSLLTLIISTTIAYFIVAIIRYFLDRKFMGNKKYKVIFSIYDKTVSLNAIADTGNSLIDIFTGKPVVICNSDNLPISDELKNILSSTDIDYIQKSIINNKELSGIRLVPFSTLNSNGTIAVFKPNNLIVQEQDTGQIKEVNALVGINTNKTEYDAIFNPVLLS